MNALPGYDLFADQAARGFPPTLAGNAIAQTGQRTLWDILRSSWGHAPARRSVVSGAHTVPARTGTGDVPRISDQTSRVSFEAWAECVQQVLGATEGDPALWRAFYVGGATPLEAARRTVLGDDGGQRAARRSSFAGVTAGEL